MTSDLISPIHQGDALIRSLSHDDLATTLQWRNHPSSRVWFHTDALISQEQHRAWFESYLDKADDYVFMVEQQALRVAQVSLYHLDGESAEFGRLLVDPAQRGRGLAKVAIELCLRVADEAFRLRRLYLEVKPDNSAAIAAYTRAGFEVDPTAEGVERSLVMRRTRP